MECPCGSADVVAIGRCRRCIAAIMDDATLARTYHLLPEDGRRQLMAEVASLRRQYLAAPSRRVASFG